MYTHMYTYTYLVWSELINEVVHVNEEDSEILNLLISLCAYKCVCGELPSQVYIRARIDFVKKLQLGRQGW